MDNRPIGIFDSGVGGLTVAKEVIRQLPNEKIIYFGDLARLPYGSKSKESIIMFSKQIIRFLLTKNVKSIIIACGTASSNSLYEVQQIFDIPITGVVQPGAEAAVKTTINNKIGIIGTEATINSGTYHKLITDENSSIEVYGKPCPLFVPLVEEGWLEDKVTYEVARRYLRDFENKGIDTLILGCTHYPLLKSVIAQVMGKNVKLINPAEKAAETIDELLIKNNIKNNMKNTEHEFYVSDRTNKFEELAKMILKRPMMPVKKINIEQY